MFAGYMDEDDSGGNVAHGTRRTLTENGGEVDFEGPLHVDVWQQGKALVNGIELFIKLHQSSDKFRLFNKAGKAYQVEITDAKLKVCHLKLNSSVFLAHNTRLQKDLALYPYWASNIMTYSVSTGDSGLTRDNIFHGDVPNKLIVAFTTSDAYTGSYTKNPFHFPHCNLNYLELAVNGQSVPGEPFQPNYTETTLADGNTKQNYTGYAAEYLSLFQNKYPQEQSNWITQSDYGRGYSAYVFNIKPGTDHDLFSPLMKGRTRLTAKFDKPAAEPLICIVYGIFPAQFKVDEARNIIL